jgi:hypothetical protein
VQRSSSELVLIVELSASIHQQLAAVEITERCGQMKRSFAVSGGHIGTGTTAKQKSQRVRRTDAHRVVQRRLLFVVSQITATALAHEATQHKIAVHVGGRQVQRCAAFKVGHVRSVRNRLQQDVQEVRCVQ